MRGALGETYQNKGIIQSGLPERACDAKREAGLREIWPPTEEDGKCKGHKQIGFLTKFINNLGHEESVREIMDEAAIFLKRELHFDEDPDVFQMRNCVVDLSAHAFRRATLQDMRFRSSSLQIPERCLNDPSLIERESAPLRAEAWQLIDSLFNQCMGSDTEQCSCPFRDLDSSETLGDQDAVNCNFVIASFTRLLKGRPLSFLVCMHAPRGRNAKGLFERLVGVIWGSYCSPGHLNVFHGVRRGEYEHNAADVAHEGNRIVWIPEIDSTVGWCNASFETKGGPEDTEDLFIRADENPKPP